MHTLLLRIAGPMQSWGSSSKFEHRDTELEPTRSGIIGMIAGAFGMDRGADLSCFDSLGFGVRVDQPGTVLRDYHTVDIGEKFAKLTERFYLEDAVFLVGLSSEDKTFLESIVHALNYPYYAPYLGRRSCPPTGKLVLGIVEGIVETALRDAEWLACEWYKDKKVREGKDVHLSLVLEKADGLHRRRDFPKSFAVNKRDYRYRYIEYLMGACAGVTVYSAKKHVKTEAAEHDPMEAL